ncbi:hypothetical protein [Nocardia seriolae]|uniref:Uncharacterized protein n=1 Tax=Nocardia seriolae TaxID=37332 RepID=A0ABC9YQU0_9NOCA|nr:hypothetical protein [Nocardia seriolae]BEK96163.1 hypothetical protein NSER024013_40690 [Nocardia seriolae]GAM45793.1 hypothetical protein NS07_v2contig00019-0066 [Nocardia seriolae]GAP27769.1 hypothetical protein NSK11_contig00023-0018 [Nocardia seriolae]
MNAAPAHRSERVLIVGRSPSVLLEAADILRGRGYEADATNRFDHVLDDYDVSAVNVLVFGGMVPADTKRFLREKVSALNPTVTFVQGLAGMAGLIAAQTEAATAAGTSPGAEVGYDSTRRSVLITLAAAAHVTVEAWWGTSFEPPEPKSTSAVLFDGELRPGHHAIAIPDEIPSEAAFTAARSDDSVHVFTVGEMPTAVVRMAPVSVADQRLPEVQQVATHTGSSIERS